MDPRVKPEDDGEGCVSRPRPSSLARGATLPAAPPPGGRRAALPSPSPARREGGRASPAGDRNIFLTFRPVRAPFQGPSPREGVSGPAGHAGMGRRLRWGCDRTSPPRDAGPWRPSRSRVPQGGARGAARDEARLHYDRLPRMGGGRREVPLSPGDRVEGASSGPRAVHGRRKTAVRGTPGDRHPRLRILVARRPAPSRCFGASGIGEPRPSGPAAEAAWARLAAARRGRPGRRHKPPPRSPRETPPR
jgi:hypothetical protein